MEKDVDLLSVPKYRLAVGTLTFAITWALSWFSVFADVVTIGTVARVFFCLMLVGLAYTLYIPSKRPTNFQMTPREVFCFGIGDTIAAGLCTTIGIWGLGVFLGAIGAFMLGTEDSKHKT